MTKYGVIVADPAWRFDDGLKKMKKRVRRSASSQYSVMSLDDIKSINVRSIADPLGCLLALWVPGSMIGDGLSVAHAWGFEVKQLFVWVKLKKDHATENDVNKITRVGMGRIFRQSHEIALICTSGKSIYPSLTNHSQRSVALDLNEGHSIKPPTLQDRLDLMFPAVKKCELFARRQRSGWDCIGDAIDGNDIRDSVDKLIEQ